MSVDTTPASSIDTIPILWMDDEPEFLDILSQELLDEGVPLSVEPVTTIAQAEKKLESHQFCGLVVDCRMSNEDPAGHNGASFLLAVNKKYRHLPTFVYSAFCLGPSYARALEASYAIYKADKTERWPRPLANWSLIDAVTRYAAAYKRVKEFEPEKIQFHLFVQDPEEYAESVAVHWDRHKHWILEDLRRKAATWCVVCGTEIVEASSKLSEYPNEAALRRIGEQKGVIPFAYSLAFLPESINAHSTEVTPWNRTKYSGDYYPTIRIAIGETYLTDDFDTGAYQTHVSDEIVKRGILDAVRDSDHLGQSYRFFTKKIKVGLTDERGAEQVGETPVSVVLDWDDSPFVAVNRKRRVLVGRDILRLFCVDVSLNSSAKQSRIRFVDRKE